MLKTFDYFEVCKLCFASSCKLDTLLRANGFEPKTADGLQALEWAKKGEWDKIEEYCMQDAIKTYNISQALQAKLPLTGWSHTVTCTKKTRQEEGRSSQISDGVAYIDFL